MIKGTPVLFVEQDQLPLLAFKEEAHADVKREHGTHNVPYPRQIFPIVKLDAIDRSFLHALRPHSLHGDEVKKRNTLSIAFVE